MVRSPKIRLDNIELERNILALKQRIVGLDPKRKLKQGLLQLDNIQLVTLYINLHSFKLAYLHEQLAKNLLAFRVDTLAWPKILDWFVDDEAEVVGPMIKLDF